MNTTSAPAQPAAPPRDGPPIARADRPARARLPRDRRERAVHARDPWHGDGLLLVDDADLDPYQTGPVGLAVILVAVMSILTGLGALGAWVATGLWLTVLEGVIRNRYPGGSTTPGVVWAWLGWLIPIAHLVMPYRVVERLTVPLGPRRTRLLRWWWGLWIAATVGLGFIQAGRSSGAWAPERSAWSTS